MTKYITFLFLIVSIINPVFSQIIYEEQDVPIYELPNILESESGKTISDVKQWESIRRPEILKLFKEYVYGEFIDDNIKISFKVTDIDKSALCGKAIRKNIAITFTKAQDTVKTDLLIYLPNSPLKKGVPLFLGMNFFGNHTVHTDANIPLSSNWVKTKPEINVFENKASELSRGVRAYRWPIERIIKRGYGLATMYYGDIDSDFDDDFKNGIHKFQKPPKERDPDFRSSLSAWAWALTKVMDYFETDNQINHKQIAVFGHSRLGKTALWAGAIDERFAITISNNSGCGGAALSRRNFGETVKIINTSFPHWFCNTFSKYGDKLEDLPIDQHMLMSLIAPRPLYIASAVKDKWADPKGEYLSLYHSSAAFKLYGLSTLEKDQQPPLNTSIVKGAQGYHVRSGSHDVTVLDWEYFMNFADRQFTH